MITIQHILGTSDVLFRQYYCPPCKGLVGKGVDKKERHKEERNWKEIGVIGILDRGGFNDDK